jgi:hypothetical protein
VAPSIAIDLPPPQPPMIRQPGLADIDWDAADAAPPPVLEEPAQSPANDPLQLTFDEISWDGSGPSQAPDEKAEAAPVLPALDASTPNKPTSSIAPRAQPETTDDVLDGFDWE